MHIFLTGYMGVGKTTIGLQLSKILGLDFYDLDQEISNHTGKSIPEIFNDKGEDYFREIEKDTLIKLNAKKNTCIVALGGGTMSDTESRYLVLQNSICIYLQKPWLEIEKNLSKLKNRPLIKQKSPTELKAIFNKRRLIYEQSQLKMPINTEFQTQKLANYLKLLTNR